MNLLSSTLPSSPECGEWACLPGWPGPPCSPESCPGCQGGSQSPLASELGWQLASPFPTLVGLLLQEVASGGECPQGWALGWVQPETPLGPVCEVVWCWGASAGLLVGGRLSLLPVVAPTLFCHPC